MSKATSTQEKPTEKSSEKAPEKTGEKGGHSGGHAAAPSRKTGPTHIDGSCFAAGCKAKSHTFNFCDEHFDHFKFGLIKKTGELVPDYEKKIEHYLSYKKAQSARKVA